MGESETGCGWVGGSGAWVCDQARGPGRCAGGHRRGWRPVLERRRALPPELAAALLSCLQVQLGVELRRKPHCTELSWRGAGGRWPGSWGVLPLGCLLFLAAPCSPSRWPPGGLRPGATAKTTSPTLRPAPRRPSTRGAGLPDDRPGLRSSRWVSGPGPGAALARTFSPTRASCAARGSGPLRAARPPSVSQLHGGTHRGHLVWGRPARRAPPVSRYT